MHFQKRFFARYWDSQQLPFELLLQNFDTIAFEDELTPFPQNLKIDATEVQFCRIYFPSVFQHFSPTERVILDQRDIKENLDKQTIKDVWLPGFNDMLSLLQECFPPPRQSMPAPSTENITLGVSIIRLFLKLDPILKYISSIQGVKDFLGQALRNQ